MRLLALEAIAMIAHSVYFRPAREGSTEITSTMEAYGELNRELLAVFLSVKNT